MSQLDILKLLNTLVTFHIGQLTFPITRDTQLHNDLGLDEQNRVQLLIDIAEFFARPIPYHLMKEFKTFGEIVNYLAPSHGYSH